MVGDASCRSAKRTRGRLPRGTPAAAPGRGWWRPSAGTPAAPCRTPGRRAGRSAREPRPAPRSRPGRGEDEPAVGVQPQPAVLPLEQPGAEGLLDPPQRAGQARLRDAELVRRRRQVLGAGERHEPAQVLDHASADHTLFESICVAGVISRMTPRLSRWSGCPAARPATLPSARPRHPCGPRPGGYRLGGPEYRRISVALFARRPGDVRAALQHPAAAAGARPRLPLSAGQSALSVSLCTVGLGLALLVAGPVSEVLGRTGPDPRLAVELGGRSRCCARWRRAGRCCSGCAPCSASPSPACRPWPWPTCARRCTRTAHAKATGLYIGGTALGGMAGRLVAGGLADLGGWRLALGGIGLLALACALPGPVAAAGLPPLRRRAGPSAGPARHDRPAGPRAGAAGPLRHRRDADGRVRRGLQRRWASAWPPRRTP